MFTNSFSKEYLKCFVNYVIKTDNFEIKTPWLCTSKSLGDHYSRYCLNSFKTYFLTPFFFFW